MCGHEAARDWLIAPVLVRWMSILHTKLLRCSNNTISLFLTETLTWHQGRSSVANMLEAWVTGG